VEIAQGPARDRPTVGPDGRFSADIEIGASGVAGVDLTLGSGGQPWHLEIVHDARLPRLDLVAPKGTALHTADTTIDVIVRVEEEHLATVRIGERRLTRAENGDWVAAFLPLLEEGEHPFRVEAEDLAGNRGALEFTCIRDTRPPRVQALSPRPADPAPR
jgi:hypothetical protein